MKTETSARRHRFKGNDNEQVCVCGIVRRRQRDMGHVLHWFYYRNGRLTGAQAVTCPGASTGEVVK